MSSLQVVEMVVKCRVPRDEVDEYIYKFRTGDKIVRVPEGLSCKDAFDTCETMEEESTIIRAGYRP